MGPRDPKSTVLTPVEEAMIVEFCRRTLLPPDFIDFIRRIDVRNRRTVTQTRGREST
jgi:hypothetical protein